MNEVEDTIDKHFVLRRELRRERRREYIPSTNIYFRECQNIKGEPPKPWTDTVKCNEETEDGKPFCPKCHEKMYQKR